MDPPVINGARGLLVKAGLATPASRAFVVGSVVGMSAYALGVPRATFTDSGQMRPLAFVSKDPEATNYHFLAVPLGAAALTLLFS